MPSHDYAILMEPVARQLLGEPNRRLSKPGKELRFGNNGSTKVDLVSGTFTDFEGGNEKPGGGVLDLIRRKVPEVLDLKDAHKWLETNGHIRADQKPQRQSRPVDTRPAPLGKPVATYDYVDENGKQHLQVLRYEPKTFRQRRRPNDNDQPDEIRDGWVWSATGLRGIPYRLPDLKEAIAHERMIFIVEGEKDVERLRAIGLPATCNIAGAGKWNADYAPYFKGANVVVIADVDPQAKDQRTEELRFHDNGEPVLPGQDHARHVCNSLIGIASEIRYLELPDVPLKGDVSDWLDAGGTADQLIRIAESIGVRWGVEKIDTSSLMFRAVNFASIKLREGARYLIRGVLPLKGILVVWGMRKCGKSFWMMDALLHVALGLEYRGQAVEQGRVIYLVLEGEEDYDARVLAWKMAKLGDVNRTVPFDVIFCRLKLVKDVDRLIADLRLQFPGEKIVAICIDTLNRSYTGSESSDQDMTLYVDAAETLGAAFDCLIAIVHHCGLDGQRPRGHTALSAAANGQIKVSRYGSQVTAEVEFLKGGRAGIKLQSEEEEIEVGRDHRGGIITSLVLNAQDDRLGEGSGGLTLRQNEVTPFEALMKAIRQHGVLAPAELDVPAGTLVVEVGQWTAEYRKIASLDKSDERLFDQNVKKHIERHGRKFRELKLIGRDNDTTTKSYIWRTHRRVKGFDDVQPKVDDSKPTPSIPGDFL